MASVVTSTLLAGLGFSGGVISSLPGSLFSTQAPPSSPSPTRQAAKASSETAASDSNALPAEGNEVPAQDEQEEEGDEDEDEEGDEEKGEDDRKEKNEADAERDKTKRKPSKGKETVSPFPTSQEREQGGPGTQGDPSPAPPGGPEDQLEQVTLSPPVEHTTLAMWEEEEENSTAEMQLPSSPTRTPQLVSRDRNHWPFPVHTGKGACPLLSSPLLFPRSLL